MIDKIELKIWNDKDFDLTKLELKITIGENSYIKTKDISPSISINEDIASFIMRNITNELLGEMIYCHTIICSEESS